MSSIIGPWDEASESGPLRATLPMEVATVSMYFTPVALSLIIQLALMVEIPEVTTTPMDMAPRGSSEATSSSSGVCRQAVTTAKLHGRVVGHMTSNAPPGEESFEGWRSLVERLAALPVWPGGAKLAPLLASKSWMIWGYPQWPCLVGMDGELSATLGFSPPWLDQAHTAPQGHWQTRSLDSVPPPSWGVSLPGISPHQRKRSTLLTPPSTLLCPQPGDMAHLLQVYYSPPPNA